EAFQLLLEQDRGRIVLDRRQKVGVERWAGVDRKGSFARPAGGRAGARPLDQGAGGRPHRVWIDQVGGLLLEERPVRGSEHHAVAWVAPGCVLLTVAEHEPDAL